MASTNRTPRKTGANRDRRRDQIVDSIKERPYAAAALATVAAGAAAFLMTRGKSDKPLMKWGQADDGDQATGGATATDSTSPSAVQAATLADAATPTNAAAAGAKPASDTATSDTKTSSGGIDATTGTDTKVGAIAYGA